MRHGDRPLVVAANLGGGAKGRGEVTLGEFRPGREAVLPAWKPELLRILPQEALTPILVCPLPVYNTPASVWLDACSAGCDLSCPAQLQKRLGRGLLLPHAAELSFTREDSDGKSEPCRRSNCDLG